MSTPEHVWIVEMKEGVIWSPTAGCSLTRHDAQVNIKVWRRQNPHDQFRIAKYYARVGGAKLV